MSIRLEDINSKKIAMATLKAGNWVTVGGHAIGKIEKITGNKITFLFTPEALEPSGFRDNMYEYLGDEIAGYPVDAIIDRLSIDVTTEGHPHIVELVERVRINEARKETQNDSVAQQL